ncbi:MAG: cytochrome c biogenesis protein CcdA [Chloroflexi bacterium]|nr:cytochrome c biogenesis protein CcdA [Chloroflexota bacterium]
MELDLTLLQDFSLLALGLVFLGGIITSIGPCNIATIPLIMGYVGGSHNLTRSRSFVLALAFAIGLALTFMLLGVVAALIGGFIGVANQWWYYLVAGICFIIGLNMLGVLKLNLPQWFGGLRERIGLKGLPGALALGLVSGLVASQCATPVLAAILTYVMAKGALLYGAVLLFTYALGRGVPVVLAGTFTGALKNFQKLGRWSEVIEKTSGVIVIGVGMYFLWIA